MVFCTIFPFIFLIFVLILLLEVHTIDVVLAQLFDADVLLQLSLDVV